MTITINTEAKTISIEGMIQASVLQAVMTSLGDDIKYYTVVGYSNIPDWLTPKNPWDPTHKDYFVDPTKFTVTC